MEQQAGWVREGLVGHGEGLGFYPVYNGQSLEAVKYGEVS